MPHPSRSGRRLCSCPWLQVPRECFCSSLPVMVLSYSLFRFLLAVVAVHHDRSPKSLDLWFVSRLMLCNQKREDGRQQHKNERLHNAHAYFHEIEGNRQERRKPRVPGRQPRRPAFPGVTTSKTPEGEHNGPARQRNH